MTIGDIGRPSSPDDWRGGAQASALETARRGSTTRAGPLSFLTECLSSNLADSLYDMPHAVRADGVQRHAIGLQLRAPADNPAAERFRADRLRSIARSFAAPPLARRPCRVVPRARP